MITLQIPEPTPSLNEFINKHWTKYRSYRRHWSMLVLVAKNRASVGPWEPFKKSKVTITRENYRLLDEDNLTGGAKLVCDGLRDQRLLVDDSPDHMQLTVTQVKIPRCQFPRTTITIEAA